MHKVMLKEPILVLANSMKALNAEFQEFMVEAVTPMLPALSKMIQSLRSMHFKQKIS